MPVTRSATRAAELQSENSNTAKPTAKQAQATTKSSTSATLGKSGKKKKTAKYKKPSSDSEYEDKPQERSFLEWISLKDLPGGVIPNSDDVFSILQEIQKLKGCTSVHRGRPYKLSDIEWLMIEWDDEKYKKKFLNSKLFSKLEKALAPRLYSRETIQSTNENYTPIITGGNPVDHKQRLYELLTVYFPADIDKNFICPELPYWYHTDEEWAYKPYPLIGFEGGRSFWIEGNCEYQGEPARRLVYFLEFVDKEAEQNYKEKVKWWGKPVIRDGKPNSNVMVNFFHQLENLGMIGYDSLHVLFVEVLHYVPEHYVRVPPSRSSYTPGKEVLYERYRNYTAENQEIIERWDYGCLMQLPRDSDPDL
ncbi:unnamed protein product [Penicillium pancosmium]